MKKELFTPEQNLYFDDFLAEFTAILKMSVPNIKSWEDETILITIQRADVEVTELTKAKLLCYKNVDAATCEITTPLEFSNLAYILNNEVAITDSLDTIPAEYVAWALECLEKQDSDNIIKITEEVAEYIALCLHDAGFYAAPEGMSFIQGYLADMNKRTEPEKCMEEVNRHKDIHDYLQLKRKE